MSSAATDDPFIGPFLRTANPPPLGPGQPDEPLIAQLSALPPAGLFPGHPIEDPAMAACCLAGLFLRHGDLASAHRLAQEIETPSGYYWHALMHRREMDYPNSRYWFRRIGAHPVLPRVSERAREIARLHPPGAPIERALLVERWSPFVFMDWVEKAIREGGSLEAWVARVALAEWEELFAFCHGRAITAAL